jgi:hypothetical protein
MGVSQSRIGCHTVGGAWGLALMTTGGGGRRLVSCGRCETGEVWPLICGPL